MTTIEDLLSHYDEPVVQLALTLRQLVLQQLPNITEIPDAPAKLVGYGYGTGYKDTICTILLSKKGVKLGLWRGTELPDPTGLLAGTGKLHKYVEIKNAEAINNPALAQLLQAALKKYGGKQ